MNKKERKEKAIELLEELNIYTPYIDGFKNNNDVCYYENYAGYWAYQDNEIINKIKDIENKYNCTIYAITHEYTEFGECYDFLLVTEYKDEWNDLIVNQKPYYNVFAYVWNKDDDSCSEFGTICVASFGGGLKRIG